MLSGIIGRVGLLFVLRMCRCLRMVFGCVLLRSMRLKDWVLVDCRRWNWRVRLCLAGNLLLLGLTCLCLVRLGVGLLTLVGGVRLCWRCYIGLCMRLVLRVRCVPLLRDVACVGGCLLFLWSLFVWVDGGVALMRRGCVSLRFALPCGGV